VRVHKISKQGTKWTQSLVMESDIHKAEVWRVQWNVTGTLLASAGDDGAVRVFRRTPQGNFAPILNIKEPDGSRFD
jgi:nucleoporin SEH1